MTATKIINLIKEVNELYFENYKTLTKKIEKTKRPWLAKAILRKEKEARNVMFPDFILYYKATELK